MIKANNILLRARIVAWLLPLALAACHNIDYQDRARTPLKPMKSVVHVKSDAFDVPPKVLEGTRPEYPALEADRREKGAGTASTPHPSGEDGCGGRGRPGPGRSFAGERALPSGLDAQVGRSSCRYRR